MTFKEIKAKNKVRGKAKKKRPGDTKPVSVSVTKFFRDLIKEYELSPTDLFRRGVAVSLHDIGVTQYRTPMNQERSEFIKKFFSFSTPPAGA